MIKIVVAGKDIETIYDDGYRLDLNISNRVEIDITDDKNHKKRITIFPQEEPTKVVIQDFVSRNSVAKIRRLKDHD